MTLSLLEQTPDQPLLSWEAQIDRLPTAKAAFLLTRAQLKLTTPGAQPEPLQTIVEPKLMMEQEMATVAKWRRQVSNLPGKEYQPASLSITIDPGRLQAFVHGYREDQSFRHIWKQSTELPELEAACQFYKSSDGLLIFRDANWVT